MTDCFQDRFGRMPGAIATAPGRVNLLGEHTDYSDGYVLPIAIPQQTTVQLGLSPDGDHHFYSENLDALVTLDVTGHAPQGFSPYLLGCIRGVEANYIAVPPLQVYIQSTVPIGAGLSSSAALEISMLRALRQLLDLSFDDVKLAQLGQRAEHDYAGVQCGIMDQMAVSLTDTYHLLFLDTRSLAYKRLPLPAGSELLILDSGLPRKLASSGYNQRRQECEMAATQLNISALRDVSDVSMLTSLPNPLQARARHVVTENQRVIEASQGVSAERFGQLMNASHTSLRDDYEVSIPGLDHLVALLRNHGDVWGTKLTGAGFGGACVALVKAGQAINIADTILASYRQAGYQGRRLVP